MAFEQTKYLPPPGAYRLVHTRVDIDSCVGGHRDEDKISFGVITGRASERSDFVLDFVEAGLVPFDGWIVHFVDNDDNFVDTGGPYQSDMFSCLSPSLETSL